MGFKMVLVPPNTQPDWPQKIRAVVPDCDVHLFDSTVAALQAGEIAGAGLDVFQVEPLPPEHPLWTMPGVLLTPHVAGVGPYLQERRTELLLENCRRFAAGEALLNVVDKSRWF